MGSVRNNNGQVEIAMETMGKEERTPKDFKTMLKQDIEAEFSDWDPGMEMFTVLLDSYGSSSFSKFIRVFSCLLGIAEQYSYLYSLYLYFINEDYVWFSLSAVSFLTYIIYVSHLSGIKAPDMDFCYSCNYYIVRIFGFFLGILQLGQPFIIYDLLSGRSVVPSVPPIYTLQKMDMFKVFSFSLPQLFFQFYTFFVQYSDTLRTITLKDWETTRKLATMVFSVLTISYSVSQFYISSRSQRGYKFLSFVYCFTSTALRALMYGSVAVILQWGVFILFAIGAFIRSFIIHARPGDPNSSRFSYVFSAVLFSFVINIDPNVSYIPILILADIEIIIGIGVAVFLPQYVAFSTTVYTKIFFFDAYWDKILIAASVTFVVMNVAAFMLLKHIQLLHIQNLTEIFYRFSIRRDKTEIENPHKLPSRFRKYADCSGYLTPAHLRRYRFNEPHPQEIMFYDSPKYSDSIAILTRQFRVNPRCSDTFKFRAQKLLEERRFKEAIADCTYGMNPYFGLYYQDTGVTFNRLFYMPKTVPDMTKMAGIHSTTVVLLATRLTCFLELNELLLASLDRRRLALALHVADPTSYVLKKLLTEPFSNSANTKSLEVDENLLSLELGSLE